jgi:hypothetical protein
MKVTLIIELAADLTAMLPAGSARPFSRTTLFSDQMAAAKIAKCRRMKENSELSEKIPLSTGDARVYPESVNERWEEWDCGRFFDRRPRVCL